MKHNLLKAASVGVAFLSFSYASAQMTSDTAALRSVYITPGWQQNDLSALNERLAANNYPAFKGNMWTTGFGFQENNGRRLGILDVSVSRKQENRSAGKVFSMMNFQISANFGYALVKTETFALSPTVGIGGGVQYFSITADRNFDEILKNPVEQNVTLWNQNFLLNASLNSDFLIPSGETPNNRLRFILVGLRGGYTFAPWSKWRQNNGIVSVVGSPESNMTGVFVQLKLGFSTKEK